MLLQKINAFIFLMQEKTLIEDEDKECISEHFDFGLYGDTDNDNYGSDESGKTICLCLLS